MAKNSHFLNKKNKICIIYGFHAVNAALRNPKRVLKKLILSESSEKLFKRENFNNLKDIEIISNKEFNKTYYKYENNQGVLLETFHLESKNINQIISDEKEKGKSIILMLDQVVDPFNIGSIMRTAALFNCTNIITTKDSTPDMNSTIIKSACGAVEIVNYLKVANLVQSINKFKDNGYWVVGLGINNKKNIDEFEIPKKCIFILGSENVGLRKLTEKNCDYNISIKNKKNENYKIDSLSVSNAATIVLYEYYKKN